MPRSGASSSITEPERYMVLAGIHMWDLQHDVSVQKRNWVVIGELAEVGHHTSTIKRVFRQLSKHTVCWFPYPVILEKDLTDSAKRKALFGIQEVNSVQDEKTWDQIVQDVVAAATVVEPWMMYTSQAKHFLGFHDGALNMEKIMGRYDKALDQAKTQLPVGVAELYAGYVHDEATLRQKDYFFVRREMTKLITLFWEQKHSGTIPLRLDRGVQSLTDVSYYRRQLFEDDDENYVRMILSDFELMEFFKGVLQHGFDPASDDPDEWSEFLSLMNINGMFWKNVQTDFYRVFLPRFELIKTHLAPDLDISGFEFGSDIVNVYRVIYHSCKDYKYFEVLRTVTVLDNYGWLNLDLLGGLGPHYCSFKFVIKVLKVGAVTFDTSRTDYLRAKAGFISDLFKNYRRLRHRASDF